MKKREDFDWFPWQPSPLCDRLQHLELCDTYVHNRTLIFSTKGTITETVTGRNIHMDIIVEKVDHLIL